MATVIGISGISGAGTTTLTKALGESLHATTIFWDDFDDISESPEDYVEWLKTSKDYAAWRYPALADTLITLKAGHETRHPATGELLKPTNMIIFDAPLGRLHKDTGQYIDVLLHVDTSMDVALARRLLRDYRNEPAEIIADLDWYLQKGRPLFETSALKDTADIVLDGNAALQIVINRALEALRHEKK